MKPSTKKTAAAGATLATLALGLSLGVQSAWADPTPIPTPTPGTTSTATPGTKAPGVRAKAELRRHKVGVELAHKLATKLGIDKAEVTKAIAAVRADAKAARATSGPSAKPTPGTPAERASRQAARQADFAKALAAKLGIDQAKVTQALADIATEQQAHRASALTTRLAQAVADGKLTQSEADAVQKAVTAGVIGGRAGHR